MEDFPRDLAEFEARFPTRRGLSRVPVSVAVAGGFPLPALRGRPLGHCVGCCWSAPIVVTRPRSRAGTIFQDTRKPLTLWTWLHKLQRAMVRPGRHRLSDRIEV